MLSSIDGGNYFHHDCMQILANFSRIPNVLNHYEAETAYARILSTCRPVILLHKQHCHAKQPIFSPPQCIYIKIYTTDNKPFLRCSQQSSFGIIFVISHDLRRQNNPKFVSNSSANFKACEFDTLIQTLLINY